MPQSERETRTRQDTRTKDEAIQDGLDALNYLKEEFERQGHRECAEILGRAFDQCLRVYVGAKASELEQRLVWEQKRPGTHFN